MHYETIASAVLDAAFAVHTALGPGMLESCYEACLAHELRLRRVPVACQVALPFRYKDLVVPTAFRADLIAGDCVLVEVKATDSIVAAHVRQTATYLRCADLPLGLLLNFAASSLRNGIRRVIHSRAAGLDPSPRLRR